MTELEATMRDGTVLRADVCCPVGDGPWPVLVVRTPYGKRDAGVLARLDPAGAVRRGYVVIIQDCRGRFASDGVWEPLRHEGPDGYDTIEWAASLPESDGRVGTYGPSYLGHTQQAARAAGPPRLLASVPAFTWSDPDDGLIRRGGAYEVGLMTQWTLNNGFDLLARRHRREPEELRRRLTELHRAVGGRTWWELPADDLPALRRLGLSMPNPSGNPSDILIERSAVPALTIAGWFDCFLQGSLDNHVAARDSGAPAALIVGPWTHDNQTNRVGGLDFGPAADAAAVDGGRSLADLELDFLDRYLKPEASRAAESPVLVFVMGAGVWRRYDSWPPQSTEESWYLHPDARLAPYPPSDSSPDTFIHDAEDPVPTLGGAILIGPEFPAGPIDQAQVERRDDVLVYTSRPIRAPLEVIGRIRVHLFAESTADSTDWVARLCDVAPDGVSRIITDGVLRTAQADAHVIDLWSTAHVFQPGHHIRLQIASSCFPRWDRNPATARARQTVHHDSVRLSRLVLPIVGAVPCAEAFYSKHM